MKKHITTPLNTTGTLSRRTILKGIVFSALGMGLFPATALTAHANTNNKKVLIAYFSHTGNTEALARTIHSVVGGDMLELKERHPYPAEHNITEPRAKQEWEAGIRVPLANEFPADINAYGLIFVGYPIWFRTTPMVVLTFLEQFKFVGKTIVPFCTHGGNGLANSPRDIARSCPQATLLKGLAVRSSNAASSQNQVQQWLQSLGFIAA